MGRSHHRAGEIATVVSRVLHAASICAPVALLGAPATLTHASESKALAADIPAQPLEQALAAFAKQTGLHLMYVSAVAANHRSHAVASGLSVDEALARLMQGTGLQFEYLTPGTIRIFAATPSAETGTKASTGEALVEVIITANRREENLQDVPITVQTINGEQLKQLNVTTFNDSAASTRRT